MVLVNHFIKSATDPIPNDGKWNSTEQLPDRCSWACHNQTIYCIEHHVKMNTLLLKLTKPLYFGEITLLHMLGNYSFANILILVIGVPFFIWYFLIKIIDTLQEIKEAKE
jgi:hypothetical protein